MGTFSYIRGDILDKPDVFTKISNFFMLIILAQVIIFCLSIIVLVVEILILGWMAIF